MKDVFNIVLRRDTCEPICLKLGLMPKKTKFYSSFDDLMFTEGHSFSQKLELVKSFFFFFFFFFFF